MKDGTTASLRRHELIRTGSLSLLVADIERALSRARSVAEAQAGDVTALDDQRPASAAYGRVATLTVAVPEDRFEETLDRLTALGIVRSRRVTAVDVGDRIVDVAARLRNLRRTEGDMLRIMDRSGHIGEVLDVENQLTAVRESIEELAAESADLQHRVAYATIDVTVATEPAPSAAPTVTMQLDAVWRAAVARVWNVTLRLAGGVFIAVAFLPYWLGIAALIVFAAKRVRGRFAGISS